MEIAPGEHLGPRKISGLSVADPVSISITSRTCCSAPRAAPCTCGMQRRQ